MRTALMNAVLILATPLFPSAQEPSTGTTRFGAYLSTTELYGGDCRLSVASPNAVEIGARPAPETRVTGKQPGEPGTLALVVAPDGTQYSLIAGADVLCILRPSDLTAPHDPEHASDRKPRWIGRRGKGPGEM